jgi:hypothetical protein
MNQIKTIYESLHPMSKGAFGRALGVTKSKLDRLMAGENPHPNLLARAKQLPMQLATVERMIQREPSLRPIPDTVYKFAEMARNDPQAMEDFDYLQSLHAANPELYDISCEMWIFAFDKR